MIFTALSLSSISVLIIAGLKIFKIGGPHKKLNTSLNIYTYRMFAAAHTNSAVLTVIANAVCIILLYYTNTTDAKRPSVGYYDKSIML